jgi:hypothetical protein
MGYRDEKCLPFLGGNVQHQEIYQCHNVLNAIVLLLQLSDSHNHVFSVDENMLSVAENDMQCTLHFKIMCFAHTHTLFETLAQEAVIFFIMLQQGKM